MGAFVVVFFSCFGAFFCCRCFVAFNCLLVCFGGSLGGFALLFAVLCFFIGVSWYLVSFCGVVWRFAVFWGVLGCFVLFRDVLCWFVVFLF